MKLRRGRVTRRGALAAAAIMTMATPAFASLVIQNYMEAEIEVTEACFVKVAGDDATSYTGADADNPMAAFDGTGNTIEVDGVDLIEEKLTLRGMQGDRVFYTDIVRYQNNCDVPINVQLTAGSVSDAAGWADKGVRVYISDTTWDGTTAPEPAFGVPGTTGSGWNDTAITVAKGGTLSSDSTGIVPVGPGQEVRGAVAIVAEHNATLGGTATVNWIATATHAN